jgi:hypothetical protein
VSLPDLPSERPRGVLVRKPQSTIYTTLAGLAAAALAIAGLLLLLQIWEYGPLWERPWVIPPSLRQL